MTALVVVMIGVVVSGTALGPILIASYLRNQIPRRRKEIENLLNEDAAIKYVEAFHSGQCNGQVEPA